MGSEGGVYWYLCEEAFLEGRTCLSLWCWYSPCLLLVRRQDWSPTRACGGSLPVLFSVSSGSPVLNGGAYGTQKSSWPGVAMVGVRARWKGVWNGWLSL